MSNEPSAVAVAQPERPRTPARTAPCGRMARLNQQMLKWAGRWIVRSDVALCGGKRLCERANRLLCQPVDPCLKLATPAHQVFEGLTIVKEHSVRQHPPIVFGQDLVKRPLRHEP